ncbi:MAG TPA: SpoIIE family protein phosphatase [Vicinamibacterales bacterium]|jgi:serine phosphatase RsbU (regulator of sigma subunit)/cell pole-organizing protein PopZ|nr:SpoIIE family protein phosphatase [Vicinamibacterales bacterium]
MNLRLRLIVAFFLLSVVPLAAVTLYTYTGNADAMRDAAGHEATLLASELTQRMEIVTAQLGQRVERLMDATSASETTPAQTAATPAATPAAPAAAEAAAPAASQTATNAAAGASDATGDQVAASFGDLALLLNNVEFRGLRGRGGRRGGDRFGNGRGGPGSAPPSPQTPDGSPQTPPSDNAQQPAAGTRPNGPPDGFFRGEGRPQFPGDASRGGGPAPEGASATPTPTSPFPPGTPRIGAPGMPPPPSDATLDPNRLRIDMGPIRDDVVRQFVPDGRLDQLSAEDRQRVFGEVNQRMLGIRQGIEMLQAQVAQRAADAKAQAADAKTRADAAKAQAGATVAETTPTAAAPAAAPATPASAAKPSTVVTAPRTQRRTAISGSRLDVRVEQNGEVVGQANAEINLPNLLSTVFTATHRDRGEVPFAVAKDGHLYTPTTDDKQTIESLHTPATGPDAAPGTTVLPEWVVVTAADPTGSGLKFGIARPIGSAIADLQRTTARNVGFGLAFIGLALIGIVPLSSRLTRNLSSLSDAARRIAQGDYHARVDVRSHDEVGRLAATFNQMAADVEAHQRAAVEQERLRRELELGRQIQHDMLPQAPLRLGLTEIKGVSVPAREVGGDFFNYFPLADGTVALLVGDVSGKGVGAALLMANIQASLRTRLALGQDLAALARELDRDVDASTPGPVYATLFVGILDPITRLLRCVNAGHNPQYVLRQSGGLERVQSTGLPIGLLSGHGYTEQRLQLAAGDLLFFYTDGCVEAEDPAGELFGSEQLEAALVAASGASADQVLASVEAEITRFRAGRELPDDATMMAVKVG